MYHINWVIVLVAAFPKTHEAQSRWISTAKLGHQPNSRNDMVDHNGVWWHQQRMQSLRNFRKLHPRYFKDLESHQKCKLTVIYITEVFKFDSILFSTVLICHMISYGSLGNWMQFKFPNGSFIFSFSKRWFQHKTWGKRCFSSNPYTYQNV